MRIFPPDSRGSSTPSVSTATGMVPALKSVIDGAEP